MAKKPKKHVPVEMEHPDKVQGKLKRLGGSNYDDFNQTLANQVVNTLWMPEATNSETRNRMIQTVMAAMTGIAPQDETEGMLAAQMVATHNAALECYRRAMIEGQTFEGREQNLRFADRLSKTYAQQLDALKRYRRKADQTVRIERVVVNDGGQAIVGNVTRGGGDGDETDEQPHAPAITDERGSEVLREDAFGEPVPVARSAR
ncbi:MAG: hypothetical protein ISP41_15590 [Alphaproteobacteria bacterium]|nr:hypothetical protein [Alphaproteobacteria bacterium]